MDKSLPPHMRREFVIRRPIPSLTPTIWRDEERYVKEYWGVIPGCFRTGDVAYKDEDGYIWFLGRLDETIKISAQRIGTVEIENVIATHNSVQEVAVVGVPDKLRGEAAIAVVVLKQGHSPSEALKAELKELVRREVGPVAVIKNVLFTKSLPKNRAGKILRRLIREVLTGRELNDYSTIEEWAALEDIMAKLKDL